MFATSFITGRLPIDLASEKLREEADEMRALLRFIGERLERGELTLTTISDRTLPGDDTTTVRDLIAYYGRKGGAR